MAEENGTPTEGADKATFDELWMRATVVMSALGVVHEAPTPLDRAAIGSIVAALVNAVADPSPSWAQSLADMADIARGAAKPRDTFDADILCAVKFAESALRLSTERKMGPPNEIFFTWSHDFAFRKKLFEGLNEAAALRLLDEAFGELNRRTSRKPVGVIVDLIHKAVLRGVRFPGAKLSKRSTRSEIANLVNSAKIRADKRAAGG